MENNRPKTDENERSKLSDTLAKSGKPGIYRDPELPGFQLRIGKRRRTWVIQGDLWQGKKRIRTVRARIGHYPDMKHRAARAKAGELLALIHQGIDPFPPKKAGDELVDGWTFKQAYHDYTNAHRNLATRTVENYNGYFKGVLAPLHNVQCSDITARTLEAIYDAAEHRGGQRLKAFSLASSVLKRARILNPTLSIGDPVADFHVLRNMKEPRREKKQVPRYSDDQLRELGEYLLPCNDSVRGCILTTALTGCRIGEARLMEWGHVDFDKGTIFIPAANKKERRDLLLPMTDQMRAVLAVTFSNERYCFPGRSENKPLSRSAPAKAVRDQGCAWFSNAPEHGGYHPAHRLRNTFIQIAKQHGCSTYHIAGVVNHAFEEVTEQMYGDVSLEEKRAVLDVVNRHLEPLLLPYAINSCIIPPTG